MDQSEVHTDKLLEDEALSGQNFVCLSFLSPENNSNCKVKGLKIRGVYATEKEAKNRCLELHSMDPYFHVFVGEVGKWLPWDPDPNDIKDQIFKEKELNKLMHEYKKNLNNLKEHEMKRKRDLVNSMREQIAKDKENNQ